MNETSTTTTTNVKYDLARYPTKDTIKMLTFLLEKVIKANDSLLLQEQQQQQQQSIGGGERRKSLTHTTTSTFTCFQARSVPSISIYAYLTRILKYCPCVNECFLALLVYFDRMAKATNTRTCGLRIDSFNIHRLIISGVMVSSKLFSDVFFTNTRYAKVGGLPVAELNILELEFLSLNDFALFVSLEELQHYGDQLLSHWQKEYQQSPVIEITIKEDHDMDKDNEKEKEEDELAPPVRRRARHLSIDKHGDELDELKSNKKQAPSPSP